jgi:hypothetical protein
MTAPTIFGRPMTPCDDGSVYSLRNVGAFSFHVGTNGLAQIEYDGKLIFHDVHHGGAASIERAVREMALTIAPLLDDDSKRELVNAIGFHVCAGCDAMRAGTWEEARDVGWVHGTFGPGADGVTLCDECHAGQGSE